MPPEDLRKKLQTRPFRPFRIHLSDGAEYDVMHPELLLLGVVPWCLDWPVGRKRPCTNAPSASTRFTSCAWSRSRRQPCAGTAILDSIALLVSVGELGWMAKRLPCHPLVVHRLAAWAAIGGPGC